MSSPLPNEETLLLRALDLPATSRASFLSEACGSDASLRRRLEDLLYAHDEAERLLGPAPGDSLRERGLPREETPGSLVGTCLLQERIGEGGCGTVYKAEQQGVLRRQVAVKVIKLGLDTHAFIARFELERQTLAMMQHPNIAQIFEAGATISGRPYMVMELIEGGPITAHCDRHRLRMGTRLNLFLDVCAAVQHAHQKGVIHRDLKPSNILVQSVEGQAVPKVIDFGVAKAFEGRLTDMPTLTGLTQFVGTPVYMSPEQAELGNPDIDTRSDVYALGVLLHELLTGFPPFGRELFESVSLEAQFRLVRERLVLRPSHSFLRRSAEEQAKAASARGLEAAQLANALKGDLDWILLRCLEKDREKRYASVGELAEDLRRHLAHEPVLARPPSLSYQAGRFIRRHRGMVSAISAVAAALVIGTVVSLRQAQRARGAESLASQRLKSESEARGELEVQQTRVLALLEAERQARREAELQRAQAQFEGQRAREAEQLAAARLLAEQAARRDAEEQRTQVELGRTRAEEEKRRALSAEAAAQAEATRNAEAARLMRAMVTGSGPHSVLVGNSKTLHRTLDRCAALLHGDHFGERSGECRRLISQVYFNLGAYSTSTAIGGGRSGKEALPLTESLEALGSLLAELNRPAEAEIFLREAVIVDARLSIATASGRYSTRFLDRLNAVLAAQGKAATQVSTLIQSLPK